MEMMHYQRKSKEAIIKMLCAFETKNKEMGSELSQQAKHFGALLETKEKAMQDLHVDVSKKGKTIANLTNQVDLLTEALQLAKQRHYGTQSEKYNPDQVLLFDEVSLPDNVEEIEAAEAKVIQVEAHSRKKKPGRHGIPKDWPRIEKVYDIPDVEKTCSCGCQLTCIGSDKTEQVELIPAQKYVIVHVQKKYACRGCQDTVKSAAKPAQPIPKSMAGPNLLATVLTAKYQDHLPLYRQEHILQRMGLDIARNTLSLWVIRCAELLVPLEKLMHEQLLNYDVAYADESRLQVLKEKDRLPQSESWLWLFGGGPADKFCFIYRYDISRAHTVPLEFLESFKGYLHCDGWGAYDVLAHKCPDITLSGCLYHARRKFVEADKLSKKKAGIAHQVLKLIQKLAKLEQAIQHLPAEEIHTQRLEKAQPLLDKLHALLLEKQPKVPPKSTLGKAISYTLNQWPKLLIYLQDGRLENNNNRTERGIKPFATGRKNWLFCNSVDGAVASARIYSFIETCKFHEIDPYYWLAYVLKHIPLCTTIEELEKLLPYNIDKALLNPKSFIPDLTSIQIPKDEKNVEKPPDTS